MSWELDSSFHPFQTITLLAEPSLEPANYTFEIEDCPRILVSLPQQIEPLRKHSRYRMYFLSINTHKTSPYLQNIHRTSTMSPALCKTAGRQQWTKPEKHSHIRQEDWFACCLALCSRFSQSLSVSGLFHSSVNCRELIVMQMAIIHKMQIMPHGLWWIFVLWILTSLASFMLFIIYFEYFSCLFIFTYHLDSPLKCLYHVTGSCIN